MNNLDHTLKDYLTSQTNYAVLITGKWGTGKTHYFNNTLSQNIKDTSLYNEDSKKYKPIRVSLFGLSSIQDIQTQIFLALFPFLKKRTTKLSLGLGKSIARGIVAIKGLGDIDKFITDVKPRRGDWIKLEQLVLCFDDLERKSDNLPINELIGYINTLVENNNAKIIILANEGKIDDELYDKFKEKVIGVTVEFLPDIEHSINSIIKQRYGKTFSSFESFLKNHSALLVEFTTLNDNNLRVVLFTLEKLHKIYSLLKKEIFDLPENKDSLIKDKLNEIVRFIFAVCIEYKNQKITFIKREDLDKQGGTFNFDVSLFSSSSSKVEIEESYVDLFIKRYYNSNSDYKFFDSIYAQITGSVPFDVKVFQEEFNDLFHIHKAKVLPQYEIFEKLNHQNSYFLNEKEYRDLTKEMVNYAESGKYKIGDYLTIFYYVTRFDNVLNYNITTLKNKLIKGLKKGKKSFIHVRGLGMYLSVPDENPYKNDLLEIRKIALSINDEIDDKNQFNAVTKLLLKMETNWEGFIGSMNDSKHPLYYKPIFKYCSSQKMYSILNKSKVIELVQFSDLITYRYDSLLNKEFKDELSFLEELLIKLSRKSKARQTKSRKNLLLDQISNQIKDAIEKIKNQHRLAKT